MDLVTLIVFLDCTGSATNQSSGQTLKTYFTAQRVSNDGRPGTATGSAQNSLHIAGLQKPGSPAASLRPATSHGAPAHPSGNTGGLALVR